MCGELTRKRAIEAYVNGSSPHVWGTLLCHYRLRAGKRFIPTCVGNSLAWIVIFVLVTVHPHMCGELAQVDTMTISEIGSSPHVWGTHSIRTSCNIHFRFIPTCVGNSVVYLGEMAGNRLPFSKRQQKQS